MENSNNHAPPCFAIFAGTNMSMFQGYMQPESSA